MHTVKWTQCDKTQSNCSSNCAYDGAQLQYTIQHRTLLIISPSYLQTSIIAQMLSIGEDSYSAFTRNSSRMRYSERELYDDVVYALYEIKREKKTINIPQHSYH